MRSYTEYLKIISNKEKEIINITSQIERVLKESGIKEGLCLVNSMHITSSVFINDNESGLHEDIMKWLEQLAPVKQDYKHHKTGETNADAHLKRTIMGREVVIAITNGELDFGPWENIFYGEFDGKRQKRVLVKIIGE
jgi:secondary thiamine-phosphate synthase enzyme